MNSLLTDTESRVEVRIINEGVKKQCRTHTIEKVTSNLSVVSCVFISIVSN
ncbi:MAG: hypothetical protein P8M55_06270 [Gammaproteobacteria bacterium]|nr:hypothetical protein [Gammaproteobacteria bacterium]